MTGADNAQPPGARGIDDGSGATELRAKRPDFALVIGIDHYPNFRSLKGAVNDAQRFLDWLLREDGGGVDDNNVRFVPSKADPLSPLKQQIDDALRDLVLAAHAEGGGGRLYFHFSGHGAEIAVHDVALLLAQWSLAEGGPALSSKRYQDHLISLQVFQEIVVLLDCCRRTGKPILGLGPDFKVGRDYHGATTYFIAYAAERGRFAYENEEPVTGWQGVFTRCLLEVLHGYPGISAAQLKDVLFGKLEAAGHRPEIVNGLRPDSPFGPQGPLPILEIRFAHPIGNVRLVHYRDGVPVTARSHEVTNDHLVWRESLANGIYKLVADNGQEKLIAHEAEIDLEGGTEEAVTHETF